MKLNLYRSLAEPTGITAALELSHFGIPVRIVDKLLTPSTTSRALAVQARTLELFEQRGLSEEMIRIGNHMQGSWRNLTRPILYQVVFDRIISLEVNPVAI